MNAQLWIPIILAIVLPLSQAINHALQGNTLPNLPWLSWTPKARAVMSLLLATVTTCIVAGATGATTWAGWGTAIAVGLGSQVTVLVGKLLAILMPTATPAQMAAGRSNHPPAPWAACLCFLALPIVLGGCAGSLSAAQSAGAPYRAQMKASATNVTPPGVDCSQWDKGRIYWHGIGLGFDSVGGVAGLTSVAVKSDTAREGLQIGAVVAVALGITSEAISQGAATEWARYCSGTP
jgi:hypothetical protein